MFNSQLSICALQSCITHQATDDYALTGIDGIHISTRLQPTAAGLHEEAEDISTHENLRQP